MNTDMQQQIPFPSLPKKQDSVATNCLKRFGLIFQEHNLPDNQEYLMGYRGKDSWCGFYINPKSKTLVAITPTGITKGCNTALFALFAERLLDISIESLCGLNGMTDGLSPVCFVFDRYNRKGFYVCSAPEAHNFFGHVHYDIQDMEEAAMENRAQEISARFPTSIEDMSSIKQYIYWVKKFDGF